MFFISLFSDNSSTRFLRSMVTQGCHKQDGSGSAKAEGYTLSQNQLDESLSLNVENGLNKIIRNYPCPQNSRRILHVTREITWSSFLDEF